MTAAVVDASAAIAWLVGSQTTAASQAFLPTVASLELEAPFVFEWEVQNTLLGVLRGGGDERLYHAMLADLLALDVAIWPPINTSEVVSLARDEKLSLFDASYLKIALDRGCALISRDRALLAASQRRGVHIFDLS